MDVQQAAALHREAVVERRARADVKRALEAVHREYPDATHIEAQADRDGVFVRFKDGGNTVSFWYQHHPADH